MNMQSLINLFLVGSLLFFVFSCSGEKSNSQTKSTVHQSTNQVIIRIIDSIMSVNGVTYRIIWSSDVLVFKISRNDFIIFERRMRTQPSYTSYLNNEKLVVFLNGEVLT